MGKVFIAPANFGLGHATRDIPIIKELLSHGHEVDIATNGSALALLKKEFPYLKYYELPAYHSDLQSAKNLSLNKVLKEIRYMNKVFDEETRITESINSGNNYDLIISDGRYGVYSKKTPSIILSHQLRFKLKSSLEIFEPVTEYFNNQYFKKYDKIVVPDNEGEETSIAGILSNPSNNKLMEKTYFSGILSSVSPLDIAKDIDVLVTLSGPEPYRGELEKLILEQIKDVEGEQKIVLLGKPGEETVKDAGYNTQVLPHANRDEMAKLMNRAKLIVSRSGYTTVMEIANIGIKKGLFIPTPGCGEQEYIAERAEKKRWFPSRSQEKMNLSQDIAISKNYDGFPRMPPSNDNMKRLYSELLSKYL